MLKTLTIKWNKDRGLLDSFDPALELRLLSEEAREFYMAETIAHMLCEYADFLFVLDGTKAKFGCELRKLNDLEITIKGYNNLLGWAGKVKKDMYETLCDAVGSCLVQQMIDMARKNVVKCNNRKPNKKVDGKVIKGEDHVDPVTLLSAQLKDAYGL